MTIAWYSRTRSTVVAGKQLFQSPQQLHRTPLRALASNPDCFKIHIMTTEEAPHLSDRLAGADREVCENEFQIRRGALRDRACVLDVLQS